MICYLIVFQKIVDKEICISALKNNINAYVYIPEEIVDDEIAKLCYRKINFYISMLLMMII